MANQALDFALKFESDGTALYLSLAAKTSNLLGKHLFYTLAAQEVDHARRFDEIYRGLTQGGPANPVAISSGSAPGVESELKAFFDRAGKKELRHGASDTSGYELALEMEEKGVAAYTRFSSDAASEIEKAFFAALLVEEKQHMEAIRNVLFYITQTGDWLENDESRVWNWMNQ